MTTNNTAQFALSGLTALMAVQIVQAIPSNDPHGHAPSDVTWSQAPLGNPNAINHQHNSDLDIRLNNSYDAYAVWDSETTFSLPGSTWRYSGALPGPGPNQPFGHGYIAADSVSAIEYSFVGAGWNSANRALVDLGFHQ